MNMFLILISLLFSFARSDCDIKECKYMKEEIYLKSTSIIGIKSACILGVKAKSSECVVFQNENINSKCNSKVENVLPRICTISDESGTFYTLSLVVLAPLESDRIIKMAIAENFKNKCYDIKNSKEEMTEEDKIYLFDTRAKLGDDISFMIFNSQIYNGFTAQCKMKKAKFNDTDGGHFYCKGKHKESDYETKNYFSIPDEDGKPTFDHYTEQDKKKITNFLIDGQYEDCIQIFEQTERDPKLNSEQIWHYLYHGGFYMKEVD